MRATRFLILILTASLLPFAAAEAPKTVYEEGEMNPQNMDYDAENKMFRAHPGWLNDKLIHYYKFRMYTPMTYPTKVTMGGAPAIPLMPLYVASTDGTVSGIVDASPVVRYHTADGESYSDFMQVVFVKVPSAAAATTLKSFDDVTASGYELTESSIYVNAPLVPTGSKLEKPGGGVAPIKGVEAWYKGDAVQLFFFETTNKAFADHYNPITREGDAGQDGSGFEMTVSNFVNNGKVLFIPIWHLNQFHTEGAANAGGGPAADGQRNIIASDRKDAGYSPLWQVFWATQVPVGYEPNQASHPSQLTEANGFEIMTTPMFVNCPNIGPHGGGEMNAKKASSFQSPASLATGSAELQGALVMEAGKTVTAKLGEKTLGTAESGMMGAYKIPVQAADLASGVNDVMVVDDAGNTVATFALQKGSGTSGTTTTTTTPADDRADTPGFTVALAVAAIGAIAVLARRKRA